MAIDYSRMAEPDNWFNGFDESGNLVKYVSDPQNGNRLVTQADYDALRAQQDQGMAEGRQRLADAGGVWAGADLNARPAGVPDNWRIFGAENGQGYFWGPQEWAQPNHDNGFFQNMQDFFNPHKNGGMGILYTAAGAYGAGALGAAGEGGELAGAGGSESLAGSGANDTLGTSQGNGMWDYVDEFGYGADGQGTFDPNSVDPYGTGVDQYGNPTGDFANYPDKNISPADQGDTGGFNGINWQQIAQKYGPAAARQLQSLVAKGVGRSAGGNILDTIGNDPLQAGFNSLPFLYSLYEANRQGNQVNPILAKLSGLADTASSNTNGLVASATGPYDRETMSGRDALMADQSARGVRGSSFGDQGITNYDVLRGRGRGELVGSTQAKALGLTGDLLNSQLKGTTNAATSRNLLIGAGLSASGKLFQPQQDPFGLANLLALTNG